MSSYSNDSMYFYEFAGYNYSLMLSLELSKISLEFCFNLLFFDYFKLEAF